jgi:hypothetical protein
VPDRVNRQQNCTTSSASLGSLKQRTAKVRR